ncbi:MAG: hypothetical protein WA254_07780 [Candidatus Sulfotelmatobacter sp.]
MTPNRFPTQVPPSPSCRPPPVNRHWTETIPSVFAVIISVISLWIAIDIGGHQPSTRRGSRVLSLKISNVAGVGAAEIETLEVFWKGKPYRSSRGMA